MTSDLRHFIDLVEDTRSRGKLFSQVTPQDVAARMLSPESDMFDHASHYFDTYVATKVGHRLPARPDRADVEAMAQELLSFNYREIVEAIAPIASEQAIEAKRYVDDLGSLNGHLGCHWSHGDGEYQAPGDVCIYARIPNSSVDWVGTIAHAVFMWEEEREITCLPGAPVSIVQIVIRGGLPARA